MKERTGQSQRLIARPYCGLSQLAGRKHHLLRRRGYPIEVVADHGSVDQIDRGEQWALTLVPAVSGHVHQLSAVDGVEKGLARYLCAGQRLTPRPVLGHAGYLLIGPPEAGTSNRYHWA